MAFSYSRIELKGTALNTYSRKLLFHKFFFNNSKVIYAVIHKVWLFITYFLCVFVCCLCLGILLMLLCCLCNWACLLCQQINNKKKNELNYYYYHHHHLNGMNKINSRNDVVWQGEKNMSNFVIPFTIYSSLSNSASTKHINLWTTNTLIFNICLGLLCHLQDTHFKTSEWSTSLTHSCNYNKQYTYTIYTRVIKK